MADSHLESHADPASLRQIMLLLAGPLIMLLGMQVQYLLVPWVCAGGSELVLHAVFIVSLSSIGIVLVVAARRFRRAGGEWPSDDVSEVERERFLMILASMFSALSSLIVLGQWIATVVKDPCLV